MTGSSVQAIRPPGGGATGRTGGRHLVLVDGTCGLCSRLTRFLLERDTAGLFVFASLQSGIGREMVARHGGNPDELSSVRVVADYAASGARMLDRSRAVLFAAGQLGWPWKAAPLLRVVPAPLLDLLYRLVARLRYAVFGRVDHCAWLPPGQRQRFLDLDRGPG
jgi:predicted DCC family thiol-disulfide oxidoreductase YuxK